SPGTLEAFALEPLEREAVPAGHVRVRVLAAGLNFRDVLIALGTYPGGGAMGLEACGVVVERGEGVAGLEVGERVLVFSDGCFASEVIAPAEFVYRAPSNLSPVQNATLPVAY